MHSMNYTSAPALLSAQHMHMKISQKLNITNELINNLANSQKRDKEFCREFCSCKEFSAREAGPSKIMKSNGPNAYALEISLDLGISSTTFIISDFVEYRDPAEIPSKPFKPLPFFVSEPTQSDHIQFGFLVR